MTHHIYTVQEPTRDMYRGMKISINPSWVANYTSTKRAIVLEIAQQVGDLGYASELGNYAEYSGAPNEQEVLQYARVVIDCATIDPDDQKRPLVIGGGIANFTDVATTLSGIIRALREKEEKLKAAKMHIYVRRGGPNYQLGLAKMRNLGEEIGIPLEVFGPEATMTGICKQAIECITAAA